MAKFRRKKGKGAQKINTASLPDIVFMLLFFFMVTTTMRETEVMVSVKPSSVSEVKKLEQKSLVSYIYIGRPIKSMQSTYGSEPMIQMNDKLVNQEGVDEIEGPVQDFVLEEREQLPEIDKNKMVMSLRIDPDIPMGKVDDVKQALRRAKALIINYSARKEYDERGR
ncbi:ExbD/TolR family protein [Bacteroidota bacterium]